MENQIKVYPKYCIVLNVNNSTSTLEDYGDKEVALAAFEAIRKNGFHIPEHDADEKIFFNKEDTELFMDIELWSEQNEFLGFDAIRHERIVIRGGEVQKGVSR